MACLYCASLAQEGFRCGCVIGDTSDMKEEESTCKLWVKAGRGCEATAVVSSVNHEFERFRNTYSRLAQDGALAGAGTRMLSPYRMSSNMIHA